jgi:hypothetical protein
MADKKLSQFDQAATSLNGMELLHVFQDGIDKQMAASVILNASSASAAIAQADATQALTNAATAQNTANNAMLTANQALNTASATTSTLFGNFQAPYEKRFAFAETTGVPNPMLAVPYVAAQTGMFEGNNINGIWIATPKRLQGVIPGQFYMELALTSGAPFSLYDEEGGNLLAQAEMEYNIPGVVPLVGSSYDETVWGWIWTKDGIPSSPSTPFTSALHPAHITPFNVTGMSVGEEWIIRNIVYFDSGFDGGSQPDRLSLEVSLVHMAGGPSLGDFLWPLENGASYPQFIEVETRVHIVEDTVPHVLDDGFLRFRTTQRIIQTPAAGEAQFSSIASPLVVEQQLLKSSLSGELFLNIEMFATQNYGNDINAWEVVSSTAERRLTTLV